MRLGIRDCYKCYGLMAHLITLEDLEIVHIAYNSFTCLLQAVVELHGSHEFDLTAMPLNCDDPVPRGADVPVRLTQPCNGTGDFLRMPKARMSQRGMAFAIIPNVRRALSSR